MPLVEGTYQPPALNPLLVPVSDAPPVDTDPYSPTYGQPTFSNLKPRANTPDVGTTAKGNPGQPAPGVPTTDVPNASPPLPNVDATFTMAPAGAPKAEPKTPAKAVADVPDYLGNAKPQVDEHGKSLQAQPAPTQPADGEVPDYLGNATPQVDTHGQPATPAYTGQYLTSGTSAGAQAVGTPPVEGFVPGAAVQAAINTATDPGQRAAIAAKQLGIPLDRIIVDAGGGRMAAVGNNGVPYYIEPQPVTNEQGGYTTPYAGPTLAQRFFGPGGTNWQSQVLHWFGPGTAGETEPRDPGGLTDQGPISPIPWQRTDAATSSSYARPAPFREGGIPSPTTDLGPNIGGAIPNAIQNALTYGPAAVAEAVGGPTAGAVTAGGMRYATGAVRQMIANALTSNQSNKQPVFTSQLGQDALLDALLWRGGSIVGKAFAPAAETNQLGLGGIPGFGRLPIERQQPYGLQDTLAPWEAPQRWELPPGPLTPPGNPPGLPPAGARIQPPAVSETLPPPAASMPIPGAVPLRPGERPPGMPAVQLNPAGEELGPAPTAAEVAAIPIRPSPARIPIVTQAQAEARADQLIRDYAAAGPIAPDERVLVPGSNASLAMKTRNAGLATLERIVRSDPIAINRFNALDTDMQNAQRTFAARLVGTPEDIAQQEAFARAETTASRNAAFANKTPTDASAAVAEFDDILAGPAGRRPLIAKPLEILRRSLFDPATGAMETDPEMLYGARQAITDALGPLARNDETNAQAASSMLTSKVLPALDNAIEAGAPGFKAYLQQFHDLMQPADAMRFLQGRNLTDATTGAPLLKPIDTLLKNIRTQRSLSPGVRPADALSDEQITALESLRDDLRRRASLMNGRVPGPGTAQELLGNQILNMLTTPAAQRVGQIASAFAGPLAFAATAGTEHVLSGMVARRQAWVREALIRRLIDANGEGVAALQGTSRALPAPNALQQ